MRPKAFLLATVAMLVVVGCTGGGSSSGTAVDPGPKISEQMMSRLHNEGLEPDADLSDNLSAPWSVATGGQAGETIDIVYDIGGCDKHLGADVTEESDSVEIAVVFQDVEGDCAGVGRPVIATVRLDAPLGTRTLLHAPTSPDFGPQIYAG